MFVFTCTSDFVCVAESLQVPKLRLGSCIDSGASNVYSPDREKFTNYRPISRDITTADGRKLKAIGTGDLKIDLPNGSKRTHVTFKDAIHSPEMAFTLISISKLDKQSSKLCFTMECAPLSIQNANNCSNTSLRWTVQDHKPQTGRKDQLRSHSFWKNKH